MFLLPFFFIFLIVLGCQKKEANIVPQKTNVNQTISQLSQSLLPLAIGNQWEYSVYKTIQTPQITNTYKSIYLFRVTQLIQNPSGEQQATIDVTSNGKLIERKIWILNKNGIYQASGGEKSIPYTPSMPLVSFPLESRLDFTWKGTGPMELDHLVTSTLTGKYLGIEGFETDMGRFKGTTVELRQEWTQNNYPESTFSQIWWIPGIGLGRLVEVTALPRARTEIIMRLKSYQLQPSKKTDYK